MIFDLAIFAVLLGSVLGSPEPIPEPNLPGGKPPRSPELNLDSAAALQRPLWATDGTSVNAVCVDYSADAYYPAKGSALVEGLPNVDFVSRPATLSVCELEKLHTECVARINKYRSGALKFSDGTDDSNVVAPGGLQPLAEATGTNECSSQQALGDLFYNVQNGGGCAGAHHTAGTCPWKSSYAQNSCCARGGGSFGQNQALATYEDVRDELFDCLQQMWDEGITPGQKGHWETMRNPKYDVAHCGFAFTASGRLMATQDFAGGFKDSYVSCSCSGKPAGADDGCGGTCIACSDPTLPACADEPLGPGGSSPACSGPVTNGRTMRCTCTDHMEKSWLPQCDVESVRDNCPVSCNTCPAYQSTCPSSQSPSPSPPPPPPPQASPPSPSPPQAAHCKGLEDRMKKGTNKCKLVGKCSNVRTKKKCEKGCEKDYCKKLNKKNGTCKKNGKRFCLKTCCDAVGPN